jgi:hypothetical protein
LQRKEKRIEKYLLLLYKPKLHSKIPFELYCYICQAGTKGREKEREARPKKSASNMERERC